MELQVIIEKLNDDVVLPVDGGDALQMRSDGILLNGKLHFWEEIMMVHITNKELFDKLKAKGVV